MLLVDNCCKILIEGFLGGYHYPQHEQGQSFTQNFEAPEKDGYYEHTMNAMEYIFVNKYKAMTAKGRPPLRRNLQPEPANAGIGF